MENLTKQQGQILDYIVKYQTESGFPPTVREIASHFGYNSANNAHQHLRLLEQKGYIERLRGKSRGIILCDTKKRATVHAPILGDIAAGTPLMAIENIEGYIELDKKLFQESSLFILRINGDSMRDVGILDGDLAVIQEQQVVESGQIAAIIIDGEATLKRLQKFTNKLVLHAENKNFKDIIVTPDQDIQISGKMVGLIRKS